jgi:hypothetical protein
MQEYTDADVVKVAKKQKTILWLVLASFVAMLFPPLLVIVGVANLVLMYQLAKALRLTAWAWCIGMVVPLVSLVLLLALNRKATNLIRSKGISVGLMGANRAQLDKLFAANIA